MGEQKAELDIQKLQRRQSLKQTFVDPYIGITGWIVVACFTLALAVFIRIFLFQSYKIPSESMYPTLHIGDFILVDKLRYGYVLPGSTKTILEFQKPSRGDVVVFKRWNTGEENWWSENEPEFFIKRILGVPGDLIEVDNSRVFINGQALFEKDRLWPKPKMAGEKDEVPPFTYLKLEADEFFVLGDNRANSQDSRYFGPVKRWQIQGRAFLVYWSWGGASWPLDVRWDRVGRRIL